MREPKEVKSVRIVFMNHRRAEELNVRIDCDECGRVIITQYYEWGAEIPVAVLDNGKWNIEGREAMRVFGRLLRFAGAELKNTLNALKKRNNGYSIRF
jgi:hypothetical protein